MPFDFHLPWLLAGLAAVVLPVVIYLFNRRYEVVEWGAMRFLQVSRKTRRKILIEDLLLLALRMLLVAVLVVGMAGPFLTRTVTIPGTRAPRDLVLIVDGSASMGCLLADGSKTAHVAAIARANEIIDGLLPSDTVGLIDAREQPVVVIAPTVDHARVRVALSALQSPEAGCDSPAALEAGRALLRDSGRVRRDLVVLTDGQRAGYADPGSRLRWEVLASQELAARKRDEHRSSPTLHLMLLDPKRAIDPPNWLLGPLRTTRGVVPVGREVLFRGEIEVRGQTRTTPPHRLALSVDGKPVRDLKLPAGLKFEKGKVPYSFTQRFTRPGSHLVTVTLEPDPPMDERPEGFEPRDFVPGDNRQDFALEVLPFLPVLLVDGGNDPEATDRGVAYLRSALAPAGDPSPAIQVAAIAFAQFDATWLSDRGSAPRPRVVILQDVPALSKEQSEAVEVFVKDGGGLLVALGSNAEAGPYNDRLFRQGRGWLPARLDRSEGDEKATTDAAKVVTGTAHPVLELFHEVQGSGSIETARFPRFWQVTVPGNDATANIMAMLRSPKGESPCLVERSFGAGRVVLCTVPLDASRGATLPRLPAFVPLVNELVSYLAGVRTQTRNLTAGQPIHYRSEREYPLESFALTPPGSDIAVSLGEIAGVTEAKSPPRGMVVTLAETRRTGVYRLDAPLRVVVLCAEGEAEKWKQAGAVEAGDEMLLRRIVRERWLDFDRLLCTADRAAKLPQLEKLLRPRGLFPDEYLPPDVSPKQVWPTVSRRTVYTVVGRDRAEGDLTPLTEGDRADLKRLTGASFADDVAGFTTASRTAQQRPEFWWVLLLGLVGLLCCEVWLTGRIVRNRG